MDNVLSITDYGMCLFSLDVMRDFIKTEKVRTKKLLEHFQKNHNRYLAALRKGIWIPFLPIDSIEYIIKLNGYMTTFCDEWEQKIRYDGFNIEVKDTLWITSISQLISFDGTRFSGYETSYRTLDGKNWYSGFKFDVPSGRYLVSIEGYARKEKQDYPNPNYGFLFSLKKVDEFNGFKDPREDEVYKFDIANM